MNNKPTDLNDDVIEAIDSGMDTADRLEIDMKDFTMGE